MERKTPSSSPAAKRRSPAKRSWNTNSARAAPLRASRRLKGESVEPEELVALPGTWISSLANATAKPGERRQEAMEENLPCALMV